MKNRESVRLFVTAAFAFCALVLYQRWEEFTRPVQEETLSKPTELQSAPAPTPPVADTALPEVTQDLGNGGGNEIPAPVAAQAAVPEPSDGIAVTIANPLVEASFNTNGSLLRLSLSRHPITLDGEPRALFYTGSTRHFLPQTGLLGEGLPNHMDTRWRIEPTASDSLTVVSNWSSADLKVKRKVALEEDNYVANYTYTITNLSDQPIIGHAYFQFLRSDEPPIDYTAKVPSFYGAAIYTANENYAKHDFDEFENYPRRANDGWIALVQRYFMAAWLDSGTPRENFMRNLDNGDVAVGIIRAFGSIEPGASVTLTQPLFAGALEQELLDQIDPSLGEDIKLAVDYGWLTILAAPLFDFLSFIYGLINNWGVAIIILTFLIKLAFFPLSAKSYRSMARMKNVAPQLQKLKERYGDDRQEFQRVTMELYRKEKINPLGGCLPILIQIPVFIALYWMLLESVELRQAPLGLWIRDLSNPDPFFVLPILLGVTMVGQFKLNPTPPDPTQAMIMKIMPIGFAAFSIIMPSGLVIYWITNTILSIAQQWQITRSIAKTSSTTKL